MEQKEVFEQTSKLWSNQSYGHLVLLTDLNFLANRRMAICHSMMEYSIELNKIKKYRIVGKDSSAIDADYSDSVSTALTGEVKSMMSDCLLSRTKDAFVRDLFSYHQSSQDQPIVLTPDEPRERRQAAFLRRIGATLIGSLL